LEKEKLRYYCGWQLDLVAQYWKGRKHFGSGINPEIEIDIKSKEFSISGLNIKNLKPLMCLLSRSSTFPVWYEWLFKNYRHIPDLEI
jgi:hypothetical protein